MKQGKLSVREKSIRDALRRKRTKKIVSISTWSFAIISIILIMVLQ
jgi:hypothetical protein